MPADNTPLLVPQNYMYCKPIQFLQKESVIRYNPMMLSIARISKRIMFIMCTFKSPLRLNSASQSSHVVHLSKLGTILQARYALTIDR